MFCKTAYPKTCMGVVMAILDIGIFVVWMCVRIWLWEWNRHCILKQVLLHIWDKIFTIFRGVCICMYVYMRDIEKSKIKPQTLCLLLKYVGTEMIFRKFERGKKRITIFHSSSYLFSGGGGDKWCMFFTD